MWNLPHVRLFYIRFILLSPINSSLERSQFYNRVDPHENNTIDKRCKRVISFTPHTTYDFLRAFKLHQFQAASPKDERFSQPSASLDRCLLHALRARELSYVV